MVGTMTKKEVILAEELAKSQKEISVSQFFERNRHLLGFDNPLRALSTTVKELVDNALDATQEMKVLPEIIVIIRQTAENRFTISVEDNGPGIVKEQIPRVFAKLLYGSKFQRLKQSRGMQGIGVSASVLYGQLTTGNPSKITSKISPKSPTHYYELHIDIAKNEPEIVTDKQIEWLNKDHGTKVEIELEGRYQAGKLSVDEYLKQTAIANPHATLTYINPKNEKTVFKRVVDTLPKEPKEIRPHPYGVELGMLIRMLSTTKAKTIQHFFTSEFARISPRIAKEISLKANIPPSAKPKSIMHGQADALCKAIQHIKIMAPPTDCLSPIGGETIIKGIKKEVDAEFFTSTSRPPSVYRGMPFSIEVAIAYGGSLPADDLVKVMRFANRVPLLHQQSACAITRSMVNTAWKNYGFSQSKGALPTAPAVILVHIASVWVPFTSESKEAIAHYPEIIKEIKLALQECGRDLARYLRKKRSAADVQKKKSYIEKYLPHIGIALKEILSLKEQEEKKVVEILKEELEKSRKVDFNNERHS